MAGMAGRDEGELGVVKCTHRPQARECSNMAQTRNALNEVLLGSHAAGSS